MFKTAALVFAASLMFILRPSVAAPPPAPPEVAASGYLLMAMHSGQVLASSNADTRLDPASLTKIMTAHVVFEEIRNGHVALTDQVLISEKAWRMEGSRMFVEVNTQVTVEELLKGLIIQSGNDAAVALAEHVAGSEEAFAALMNEHAARLGMTNSHFTNASGLPDPEHYTTPADIAKVTAATIRDYPDWYAWYAIKEYTYNGIKQPNRNLLLWRDDSVDGVKTGHTQAAGYCLVASAKRDDMRLISVVMGTESDSARAAETQKLLGYGFRFYESLPLYKTGQPVQQVRVWKGDAELLPVGVAHDLTVTVPRGETGSVSAQLTLNGTLEAPVSRGQEVGSIEVRSGDQLLTRVPAVAQVDIGEAGILGWLKDSVLMMFE